MPAPAAATISGAAAMPKPQTIACSSPVRRSASTASRTRRAWLARISPSVACSLMSR